MKILPNQLAQHYQVPSLQRGHSVFTSFISQGGKILFLDSHLERLLTGADFLFPSAEWILSFEKIKHYVESEFSKLISEMHVEYYFRLTLFDDSFYLQYRELGNSKLSLKLTRALKIKTPDLIPSFLKLSNYVESDLELVRAKLKGFDDIVFFDIDQNVTEASTSNIFIVTLDATILTPAPSSMILDGITRKKLFQKLKDQGFRVSESSISGKDLLNAREIWLTNSVKGIRFVDQFEDVAFEMKDSVFEKALEIFGRYGERV